jgi:L-histidine N-alpha-methyltransferase
MATPLTAPALSTFAQDVRDGLTKKQKQLPPKYFYDALGSALFDAICQLPWYRSTRAELGLLETHAAAITRSVDDDSLVVELGSGSGEKLALFARGFSSRRISPMVHIVDISAKALDDASDRLAKVGVPVITHNAVYEDGLTAALGARGADGRAMVLFLGSNIGNFDPPAAAAMLARIRGSLRSGDALLLGADLVKPVHELLVAYDDPLGVTAAFNRNLLVRMNAELGADFDLGTFDHRARWNVDARSIEMHLVSRRAQRVTIPGAGLRIEFAAGESIWTESSFKYDPARLETMARASGFALDEQWIDRDARYALSRFVVA